MAQAEKTARTLAGKVVSDKMDKTITVLIERRVKHAMYGKIVSKSSKVWRSRALRGTNNLLNRHRTYYLIN